MKEILPMFQALWDKSPYKSLLESVLAGLSQNNTESLNIWYGIPARKKFSMVQRPSIHGGAKTLGAIQRGLFLSVGQHSKN